MIVKEEILDYLDSLGVQYYLTLMDNGIQYSYYPEDQSVKDNLQILTDTIQGELTDIEEDLGIEHKSSVIH